MSSHFSRFNELRMLWSLLMTSPRYQEARAHPEWPHPNWLVRISLQTIQPRALYVLMTVSAVLWFAFADHDYNLIEQTLKGDNPIRCFEYGVIGTVCLLGVALAWTITWSQLRQVGGEARPLLEVLNSWGHVANTLALYQEKADHPEQVERIVARAEVGNSLMGTVRAYSGATVLLYVWSLLLTIALTAVACSATTLYYFPREAFRTIGANNDVLRHVYYAVVTLATIGYGDHYPVQKWGFVVVVFTAMAGFVAVTLAVALLFYRHGQLEARIASELDERFRVSWPS